jgi:hypothetical protein
MILMVHYCADALIERFGDECVLRNIAAGRHLSTLAWSEAGSRSHFWAPPRREGDEYALDCVKSWVTSAMGSDSYVGSPRGWRRHQHTLARRWQTQRWRRARPCGLGLSSPDNSPPQTPPSECKSSRKVKAPVCNGPRTDRSPPPFRFGQNAERARDRDGGLRASARRLLRRRRLGAGPPTGAGVETFLRRPSARAETERSSRPARCDRHALRR